VKADEDRDRTPVEIALARLRLAAFSALEVGASRDEVNAEVAEAHRLLHPTGGER
jgi:hypothetical protein